MTFLSMCYRPVAVTPPSSNPPMPHVHVFSPEEVRDAGYALGDWLEKTFSGVMEDLGDAGLDLLADIHEAHVDAANAVIKAVQSGTVKSIAEGTEQSAKWVWGVLEGGFNEKATVGQILVDAAIGMIPIVGDITAARDLVALALSWAENPKKMREPLQWVYAVVLCAALIPVTGGVLKGIGRIVHRELELVTAMTNAAIKGARLEQCAADIIALLNRLGVGHAEAWFKTLRFTDYVGELAAAFKKLLHRMRETLIELREFVLEAYYVPQFVEKLQYFITILGRVNRIPIVKRLTEGAKKIDSYLQDLRGYVTNGFEIPAKRTGHRVGPNRENITYTDELILREGQGHKRSLRGGYAANDANVVPEVIYVPKEGFPDLMATGRGTPEDMIYEEISTFSGKIVNRQIQPGETIYRVFGPGGSTLGQDVFPSFAAGHPNGKLSYWGVNDVPADARTWREQAAVLDEWNRNGYLITGTVKEGSKEPLNACVGLIAEQRGVDLGSQYLPGGGKQAILKLDASLKSTLHELAQAVQRTNRPRKVELNGIEWEIKPTGWADSNGIHGHPTEPTPTTVFVTSRLASDEIVPKERDQE